MPDFRKKPVEIEAFQWDGSDEQAQSLLEWMRRYAQECQFISIPGMTHSISIVTLEGVMYALAGDWIIRGVVNEFYPCKPDVFEQTYEPV